MDDVKDIDVLNEEIIIHPMAKRTGHTWKGEARIMGKVVIDGETYSFERVISVTFKKTK